MVKVPPGDTRSPDLTPKMLQPKEELVTLMPEPVP